MSQEKFGFIRELTLPELWQLSYAIQERIRTLSMAPSQVWHIEIQQTGGYQPGLDQVVPPCPKWYLGDGTTAMGSAHRRSACRFLLSVVVWLEISGLGSRRCLRKYVPLAVVRLAP